MKRKEVGILVCMMLLAMIPIAAGIDVCPEKDTTGPLDRSVVRGIVLFPRPSANGKNIVFFAIRLHYTTVNLGETQSGVLRLQRVVIPRDVNGFVGKFYIFASFKGSL